MTRNRDTKIMVPSLPRGLEAKGWGCVDVDQLATLAEENEVSMQNEAQLEELLLSVS
jgi:hypothetical protein